MNRYEKSGGGMRQVEKSRGMARRVWVAAALACVLITTTLRAQQPARTTISDTVYRADGSAASGAV